MINIFKKSLSKEQKISILTEACLEMYHQGLGEFSRKRIKRRSPHKARGESELDKSELFSFNFIFFARTYLDTSKDKEREKIMGAVVSHFMGAVYSSMLGSYYSKFCQILVVICCRKYQLK